MLQSGSYFGKINQQCKSCIGGFFHFAFLCNHHLSFWVPKLVSSFLHLHSLPLGFKKWFLHTLISWLVWGSSIIHVIRCNAQSPPCHLGGWRWVAVEAVDEWLNGRWPQLCYSAVRIRGQDVSLVFWFVNGWFRQCAAMRMARERGRDIDRPSKFKVLTGITMGFKRPALWSSPPTCFYCRTCNAQWQDPWSHGLAFLDCAMA